MQYDLSNLYIKFQECPQDKKLVDFFAELAAYEEFSKCKDDNFIKLAILTADIDSPISTISDRAIMVGAAFDILGIDKQKNEKLFNKIVDYDHVQYMDCWLKYLYIQNEVLFTDWMLVTKDYEYFLSQSGKPKPKEVDDSKYLKDRKALRETISELGTEKKELEAKLFPDSKAAREASVHEAKKKIHMWAEEHAEPFNFY